MEILRFFVKNRDIFTQIKKVNYFFTLLFHPGFASTFAIPFITYVPH